VYFWDSIEFAIRLVAGLRILAWALAVEVEQTMALAMHRYAAHGACLMLAEALVGCWVAMWWPFIFFLAYSVLTYLEI
jgi:hypothetical protein